MKTVIFVLGYFGSGKSTFIKAMASLENIVFLDKFINGNSKSAIVGNYLSSTSVGTDSLLQKTWLYIEKALESHENVFVDGYWFINKRFRERLNALYTKKVGLKVIIYSTPFDEAERRFFTKKRRISSETYKKTQKKVLLKILEFSDYIQILEDCEAILFLNGNDGSIDNARKAIEWLAFLH